ncbi:26S proteasome non-ATPase regulatory subunit 5-like [Planococcus citri]|uniref:26S proteasome non-ATPase regulatory subunit 5-like n=1 Tax=Planococcus citri TaxID=170843 RepID=UPI0031F92C69
MAKNLEWFQHNFSNISVDVDRVKYLEELQIALSTSRKQDLTAIVANLQLGVVFDCLNTTDKSQIELTIAVLKKLLPVLDPCDVIKLYGVHLGRALEHPEIEAKKLVISELNRAAKNHSVLALICNETPLLLSVIDCVKAEDLSLATVAANFLEELGKILDGIRVLFHPVLLDVLKKSSEESDIVRFRIYEIIVKISIASIQGLEASANSGLLINLLNELQSGDILLQLTSLETVTKLALCDHGLRFLKEKGLLNYAQEQLANSESTNNLLLTGFIKFFGNVAQTKPEEVFLEYPSVLNLVFNLCDSNDPILSNIALETVGFIASNPEGKKALNQRHSEMQNVMKIIERTIATQPTERKVVALNVLSNILQLDVSVQTPELLLLTKNYYLQISQNPMKTLKTICEKPFTELKLAGLTTLSKIVVQPWGLEEVKKCSGLIEYFLDRNEESDMNCKTIKYNLVQIIAEHPLARSIFGSDIISKFQLHVKQGICYVQSKTEVMFEAT